MSDAPSLLFVCTGNATRSVLAGALASAARPDWTVETAGTFVVEGQPMSWRTRRGFEEIGLAVPWHRSRQMTDDLLAGADVVVALACEHVHYVRRNHPAAAPRTATLKRLLRDLAPGPAPLPERIARLNLADAALDSAAEDVVDPGGGEVEEFTACARDLNTLMKQLTGLLT
jgi:protein-tyrosine phosphatase